MTRTLLGSYRETFTTGAVTTIAAETATAGHILALRNTSRDIVCVLRALEVEFLLTTAFTTAQEVGFSAWIARYYSAPHTGATALTIGGGQMRSGVETPTLTGRIANAGALTAGTQTLDSNPIARGSVYASAVGAAMPPRRYDFVPFGGFELAFEEGLVLTNAILMAAAGVGKWHFTAEWDALRVS